MRSGLAVVAVLLSLVVAACANGEEGYVSTKDGVRLHYQKFGAGKPTVLVPAALFLARDFQRLAKGRTIVFYDMRDRGRSDPVADPKHISIQDDVDDLEAVRRHFAVDKPDLIGFSYLGMMVILYATEHPDHVHRIVQLGPVPRKFDTQYPNSLKAADNADPALAKQLEDWMQDGTIRDRPKEFCERDWELNRMRLVGDPANVSKLGPGLCSLPNELPVHLYPHFQNKFATIQALNLSKEAVRQVSVPVLTIHGTNDRNAPYGSGREWAMTLPDARLLTVPGAAHMAWVEAPDLIFPSIEIFLNGKWPSAAVKITTLEAPAVK
jgi:proline iminopeptidase